jgi:hypothetical protein
MKKEDIIKIRRLFSYLKNYAAFGISTEYRDMDMFKKALEEYKQTNMREEDKIYIKILERMANAKKPSDTQIFSLANSVQKTSYAYVNFLEMVFKKYLKNRDKAIKFAYENEGTFNSFDNAIERLNNGYVNSIIYKDMAEDISNEIKKINEEKQRIQDAKKKKNTDNDITSIYHKVYNSGLSLLDYAHEHFVDTNGVKSYFRPDISGCDKEMAEVILSRKNTHINEVLDIISSINDGKMTILEYYKKTRLNPSFLIIIANEYGLLSVSLRIFVSKYKNPHNEINQIESLIEGKLVLESEEVSKETMINMYNKMKEMDMVLKYKYFLDYLREDIKKDKELKRTNN